MRTINSLFNSVDCRLKSAYYARKDFRTNRHIVVFESDDWGSIRMPDKKSWEKLLKLGYSVDKRPYERFDTLESGEDLAALFDVLMKHHDSQGHHPVFTANMLMANPDFDKIKSSNYTDYFYETISDTYNRYFGNAKVLDLMRQGRDEGIFVPQSHGREHFNVDQWMNLLRAGDEDTLVAFRYGMCGIAPKLHPERGNNLMVALRAENEQQQSKIEKIVSEGLSLFEDLWGEKSRTFVAPCYAWNERIESVLAQYGVQLIQSSRSNKKTYISPTRYFYAGQRNQYYQIYGIRNCAFEPATMNSSVGSVLDTIQNTFGERHIAVLSTHRINYVGGLNKQNRIQTLEMLDEILSQLILKYPDVEFMSSNQLITLFQ